MKKPWRSRVIMEGSMAMTVQLRDVHPDDLPILFEHQRDPVANQMADFPPRAWEPFLAHWGKILSDETTFNQTILVDGQVAGSISSFMQEGQREVGYWIGREFWGRGIATRALGAFIVLEQRRPLYAHVVERNLGSRRVLEKCGFRFLKQGPEASLLDGSPLQALDWILE